MIYICNSQASRIIRALVGLRPGRPRVRLECESLSSPMGKEFKVNYHKTYR